MKRVFLFIWIVMLLVGLPVRGADYREAFRVNENGEVLPLDSSGNTNKAPLFPHGVGVNRTNIGIAYKVWIALRTDSPPCVVNVCGSGTELDPYDGSTQPKFDAVLGASGLVGANTHVHLGKGTFPTNQIKFRENIIIEGAGKFLTTVKLADGAAQTVGSWKVFGSDAQPYYNYVSVRNLTIDTNKANQGVYTNNVNNAVLYALRVLANNADIINVRAVGVWNGDGVGDNGAEGFPFSVKHDDTVVPTDKITFDGCDIIDPYGYHTAISAFGDSTTPGAADYRVEIKNCYVQNHTGGSCFGVGHNASNSSIHNNRAYNITTGTTIDVGSHNGLRIYSNSYVKLKGRGVNMGSAPGGGLGPYSNIAIYDNYFQLDSDANGSSVAHAGTGANTGFQFYGNTVVQQSVTHPAILLSSTTSGFIRNNTISETVPTNLSTNTALEVSGNITPAGVPITLKNSSAITNRQAMSATLDSDVTTFFANATANGGTVSTTTVTALNKMVVGLKADGRWTKIISFPPMCGDFVAALTKLKYPTGASPYLTNTGFVSGDYAETGVTGGFKPDGTATKFFDMGYNPVTAGASLTSFSIGAYVSGTEANGTSRYIMGNEADSSGTNRTQLGWVSSGSLESGTIANTSGTIGATKRDGLLIVSSNGDRVMNYYDDGAFVASSGTGSGTFVSTSFYLGAAHRLSTNSASGLSSRYLRGAIITTGLSAEDVASIYSRWQNFQTALGRQVGTATYEPFDVSGTITATGDILAAQNITAGGNIAASGTGSVTGRTIQAETTVAGDGSLLTNLDARNVSGAYREVADTNTTLTTADYIVVYTTLTAARVVTLPAAADADGVFFIIKDLAGTATANPITFASAVEGSTAAISADRGVVRVQSNGTIWYRL